MRSCLGPPKAGKGGGWGGGVNREVEMSGEGEWLMMAAV